MHDVAELFAYQVYYKDVLNRIARRWKAKLGKVEDIEDE